MKFLCLICVEVRPIAEDARTLEVLGFAAKLGSRDE